MSIDGPEILMTAPELARLLFSSFVLDSKARAMQSEYEQLRQRAGFRQDAFERQEFIYHVAYIVVALGAANVGEGKPDVMPYFRALVNAEMKDRWQMTEDRSDTKIGDAARDYAELIFTDLETNRGLPLKWAQRWLKEIGIEEWNMAVLFRVSYSWKICFLSAAELLQRIRIVHPP